MFLNSYMDFLGCVHSAREKIFEIKGTEISMQYLFVPDWLLGKKHMKYGRRTVQATGLQVNERPN